MIASCDRGDRVFQIGYQVIGDLPQIVVPVSMLVPDASSEVCARHRDVVYPGQSSQLVLVADSPTNCAA